MFSAQFTDETRISAPPELVFQFFSEAGNLARLTPPSLGFEILSPQPIMMAKGTLIDYRIRLRGIPMRWRTRIAFWNPPFEFVDEQLKGPYRRWVHQHRFEPTEDGGTLMRDRVDYSLPLPPFSMVALPFVRAEIRAIFKYRKTVIRREIFAESEASE